MTGSQKALSLPTGLAVVCASPKALEARKSATLRRVYYDFEDMLKTNPSGNVPYTPSLPLLHGLQVCHGCTGNNTVRIHLLYRHSICAHHVHCRQATLELLRSEGMDNVVARHHRLAEGTRAAVEGWGLKLLCKHPRWNSDSLTVVAVPEGFDSTRIVKEAFARYNLSLGLGLSEVTGKVFRIGHLGNMDEVMMTSAISGAEMAMISAGLPITPGSGIARAIDYWQKTSKVIPTRECMLD